MNKNVCAIFVTFHPDENFRLNFQRLYPQVGRVIIVDNGSSPREIEFLKSCMQGCLESELIQNGWNLGIATALNIGVRSALARGFEWVVTFDQDTLPSSGMIDIMLKAYAASDLKDKIGLLAPAYYDQKTGYRGRLMARESKDLFITEMVYNSGSLIRTELFSKVSFFDDDLFIDYVDTDFCLKIRKAGYYSVVVPQAIIGHCEGNIEMKQFRLLSFFVHNYSPSRRYYKARNMMVIYRRHFSIVPRWMWVDLQFVIKDLIKMLLFETQRWQKLKATFTGVIDGLLSRMGSMEGVVYKRPKAEKYFVEEREEIFPMLPSYCARVLDLGCGTGKTSQTLKKTGRVGWVCGVEGSPEAAAAARSCLDQVVEGDIEKIEYPFPDESFDAILLLDILEHLVDPWTVVEKMTRLLKPGGVLIASIPNVRHFSVVFPLLFLGDWRYQEEGLLDSTHIRFFTKKTAIQLMTSSGLVLDDFQYTGAKKGSLSGIADTLSLGLLRELFIFQNLIRVRKKE